MPLKKNAEHREQQVYLFLDHFSVFIHFFSLELQLVVTAEIYKKTEQDDKAISAIKIRL